MSSNPHYNAQPRLRAGDQLREYRIKRLVGVGGMGAVYEAEHEVLGARVAVKEILFHPTDIDPADYQRLEDAFLKEARLLIRLDHRELPAQGALIPRANNLFREGEYWYLVMEYMPGDTLGDLLDKNSRRPLPVEQVEAWLIQLLSTLDYLHHQEPPLIHRDIKPSNLKVNDHGRLVLLDFGIAKGGVGGSAVTIFSPSVQFYTPHYSPPEQVRGKGMDGRTDLYAAAATMYYLLAGAAPPTTETRSYAIVAAEPDPLLLLTTVNPNVPETLAKVLQSALSLKIEDRPLSATDMRAMLLGEMAVPVPASRLAPVPAPDPTPQVSPVIETAHSLTDPIVDPDALISRTPISRPTAEPENLTTVVNPIPDGLAVADDKDRHAIENNPGLWGSPVSAFEDADDKRRRSFPLVPLVASLVVLLLAIGLGGYFLNNSGVFANDVVTPESGIVIVDTTPTASATVETVVATESPTEDATPSPVEATSAATTAAVATSTRLATSTSLTIPTSTPTHTPNPTDTPRPATATSRPIVTATIIVTPILPPVAPTSGTILTAPRNAVDIISPGNNAAFTQGTEVQLSWQAQALSAGEQYTVRVWKQSAPNVAEREFSTSDTGAVLTGLNPESYEWQVQITGPSGVVLGTASGTRNFTVSSVSQEPDPTQPPDVPPTLPPNDPPPTLAPLPTAGVQ